MSYLVWSGVKMQSKLTIIIALMMIVIVFGAGCTDENKEKETRILMVKSGGTDMVNGMNAGTMDAMIGWEPYNAEAITKGYGYTLLNSSEIWDNHPCCVLAYDYNWYEKTDNADEILNRVALAHLWATNWINDAKEPGSANHDKMITHATEFTQRDAEVIEYANKNIKFDNNLDPAGIKTYAKKVKEYEIFSKWDESGYESTDKYVDDTIAQQYLDWANLHKDDTAEDVKLNTTVTLRFGYLKEDLHQLAFWVAWKEGLYESLNITVEPYEPFANGGFEMKEGFTTNEIDIGYLGTAPAIILGINNNDFQKESPHYNDAKIKIISAVNYDGSAIVVRKGLEAKSMKDLAGKNLGYPGTGTVQHFLVLMAAEKAGIEVQSV